MIGILKYFQIYVMPDNSDKLSGPTLKLHACKRLEVFCGSGDVERWIGGVESAIRTDDVPKE